MVRLVAGVNASVYEKLVPSVERLTASRAVRPAAVEQHATCCRTATDAAVRPPCTSSLPPPLHHRAVIVVAILLRYASRGQSSVINYIIQLYNFYSPNNGSMKKYKKMYTTISTNNLTHTQQNVGVHSRC